jgi:hypothetical protein
MPSYGISKNEYEINGDSSFLTIEARLELRSLMVEWGLSAFEAAGPSGVEIGIIEGVVVSNNKCD